MRSGEFETLRAVDSEVQLRSATDCKGGGAHGYLRQGLFWRIHHVAERREQRRLGARLDSVSKRPESPSFLIEIIAGRNGPTAGPKIDRPSPGAPLHHHHCFDDRKAGAVSFRLGTESCGVHDFCGRAAKLH